MDQFLFDRYLRHERVNGFQGNGRVLASSYSILISLSSFSVESCFVQHAKLTSYLGQWTLQLLFHLEPRYQGDMKKNSLNSIYLTKYHNEEPESYHLLQFSSFLCCHEQPPQRWCQDHRIHLRWRALQQQLTLKVVKYWCEALHLRCCEGPVYVWSVKYSAKLYKFHGKHQRNFCKHEAIIHIIQKPVGNLHSRTVVFSQHR